MEATLTSMKGFPCVIICFLIACCLSTEAARLPNVVVLYADDMGYGDLGVQNPDSRIPTPNLNRRFRGDAIY